jgi:carbonic anhydrase
MSLLEPALEETKRGRDENLNDFITRLEKRAVMTSLKNLMTFPCVEILVGRGQLHLHGAYFGVAKGSLSVLDQATGNYHTIAMADA